MKTYVCHNCNKKFAQRKDSVRFKTIEGVYRYFCTWCVNKKNMKKEIRINGVITTVPFTGHVEIRDIENYLQKMKEHTHIEIIYDEYKQVTFSPYYFRLETDEEYATRIKRDGVFDEKIRLYELKELKRLKEKYEK